MSKLSIPQDGHPVGYLKIFVDSLGGPMGEDFPNTVKQKTLGKSTKPDLFPIPVLYPLNIHLQAS